MAERIISYLKKLFQDYESKDCEIQVFNNLEGLVMLHFKEPTDLKQTAQENTNNTLPPHDSKDPVTEE